MVTVSVTLKHLFSSKLRVKVLDYFFFHPGEELYVRQLASALDEPVGTVARELSHLEEAGILSSRRLGNQKHFRLREDCSILEDLRNIFLKTSGAGAELRVAMENISRVELAFLYGSYARGEAGAASDLDLMVIGNAADRELAPAVARVERRLKREINYTLYTRDEVEKRIRKKGDFVHEVFSSPRILLIGNEDDELFRIAR